MKKGYMEVFYIVLAIVCISFIGFIFWLGGQPSTSIKFYNDGHLVCKDWNDEWSLHYTNHECYTVQK